MLQEMSLVDGGYDRCSLKVSLLFVSRKKSQDSYVQRNLTGASTHLRLPWLSNFIPSGKNISFFYIYICIYMYTGGCCGFLYVLCWVWEHYLLRYSLFVLKVTSFFLVCRVTVVVKNYLIGGEGYNWSKSTVVV